MKILVCVKQVPRLDQVRFQPGINRIVREGVESLINPLDRAALGHASALRGHDGGQVVAVTMGPPGARAVLAEALRWGADRAVHLVDMRFAGADTLATARALAQMVARERPDVVLLGRSTLDGATAQVAPQLAVLSGFAQVTHATAMSVDGGRLTVWRETEEGTERWAVDLPAVVSVEDGPEPTLPATAVHGAIEELDADALGGEAARYGIRGSATYVQRVVDLPVDRRGERIRHLADLAQRIEALTAVAGEGAAPDPAGGRRKIWVVADAYRDRLHPVSAEGIAAARAVARRLDASVTAVLLCEDPRDNAAALAAAGADRVVVAVHDRLAAYAPEPYSAALAALVAQRSPFAVVGPWTARGRDYLPRVAARLELGMTGDVVGLDVDPHPGDDSVLDLVWLKPAWAGSALARVVARTVPSFGTLRPGAVAALASHPGRKVDVEIVPAAVGRPGSERLIDLVPDGGSGLLDARPVLLLVGARVDSPSLLAAGRLAAERGWGLGGTTDAIAAGHLPPSVEVSLRKRSLSPRAVIGLGLADAADLDAVRGAQTLVAVDPDPVDQMHHIVDVVGEVSCSDLLAALARPMVPAHHSS